MSNLKTQNPVDVAIAEAGRQAHGSVQWLLEKRTCPDAPEITEGNDLQFFICGQQGFAQLSSDLRKAKSTVDIPRLFPGFCGQRRIFPERGLSPVFVEVLVDNGWRKTITD